MNISELFDTYGVYIIVAAVVIVVIIIAVKIKSAHDADSTFEGQEFGGQSYKQTVLDSVPEYYRLDYSRYQVPVAGLQRPVSDRSCGGGFCLYRTIGRHVATRCRSCEKASGSALYSAGRP